MSEQCNCIEKAEESLQKHIRTHNPDREIVEEPTLQDKGFVKRGNTLGLTVFSPVLGRYQQGKRTLKWQVNLSYTYCPFCGVKYPQSEKEETES